MNTIARIKTAARTWSERHASQTPDPDPEPEEHRAKRQKQEAQQNAHRARTIRRGTGTGEEWLVTGRYKITSPLLERLSKEELILDIYADGEDDKAQMFAYFDFGSITGVMRFEGKDDGDVDCLPVPRPEIEDVLPSREKSYVEVEEGRSSEEKVDINSVPIPRLLPDNNINPSGNRKTHTESEEGNSSEVENDLHSLTPLPEPSKKRSHTEFTEESPDEEKEDPDCCSPSSQLQMENAKSSKKRNLTTHDDSSSSSNSSSHSEEDQYQDSTLSLSLSLSPSTYCHVCALSSTSTSQFPDPKRTIIPPPFLLGKKKWPTRKNPTWTYRWQGEDVGTDFLQPHSEDRSFEITFEKNRGLNLRGTFGCPGEGWECEFAGVKIAGGRRARWPVEESWHTC